MSETIDKATDKVDTYTPDVDVDEGIEPVKEQPNSNEFAEDLELFKEVLNDEGKIEITVHSPTIIKTFAERIYSDYNSAIRELYNNEARACRMARDQFHARPKIHITLNETDRKLIINGVDSLGIKANIAAQVLKEIGTSSNHDSNEVGQFGQGFASYSLLTDAMMLETNPRLGLEYGLVCDKLTFTPYATLNIPRPNLGYYGTKLEMVLKDDIHLDELVKTFEACAEFSTIPTTIELETDISNNHYSYGSDSTSYQEGTYECDQWNTIKDYIMEKSDVSKHIDDDYMKDIKDVQDKVIDTVRTRRITAYKEIHIDNEDYEFFGIIAYEQQRHITKIEDVAPQKYNWVNTDGIPYPSTNVTGRGEHKKVLLCKTPIKTDVYESHLGTSIDLEGLGNIFDYVLNIKDERKFMPESNRDKLSRSATKKIITNVVDDIITLIDDWNVENVTEFNNTLTPVIYGGNTHHLQTLFNDTTNKIINMLDTRFPTVNNKYGQRIGDLLASGSKVIYLRSLRADMMGVLREHFEPDKVVFIRNNNHYNNNLLEEFDILDGDVYKREHKLKISKDKVESDGVTNNHIRLTIYSLGGYRGNSYGFGRNRYKSKTSNTIGEINTWITKSFDKKRMKGTEYASSSDRDVMLKVNGKAVELEQLISRIDSINGQVAENILIVRNHKSIKAKTIGDIIDEVNKKEYMTTDGKMKGIKVLKHKHHVNKSGVVDKFTNITLCDHKDKLPDYKDNTNNFTIAVDNKQEMAKLWIAFNLADDDADQVVEHFCGTIDSNDTLQHYLMGNTKANDILVKAFPIDTCDLSELKTKVKERELLGKTYDKDLIQLLSNGLKSLSNYYRDNECKNNKYRGMELPELLQQISKEK
tara:strand:+ start:20 stop:2626 length:2607 start_codon:yes stop_codon:yes gene_type:complete